MRILLTLCAALAVAGCHDDVVTPTSLPVALTLSSPPPGPPFPEPTVLVDHDSVVIKYYFGTSGCLDYTSAAEMRDGSLLVTVTSSYAPGRACLAVIMYATFRVAVQQAPSGAYPLIVRIRTLDPDGKLAATSEVLRKLVLVEP